MSNEIDKDGHLPSAKWWGAKKAINDLRDHGYAVVVFSPDELDGCPACDLEGSLVEYAWEAIESLKKINKQEAHSENHSSR